MPADKRAPAQRVLPNTRFAAILSTLAVVLASPISAQDSSWAQDPWADKSSPLHSIEWTDGGRQVDIGNVAEFTIPNRCRYTDAKGARDFLLMTQNIPSERVQGLLLCPANLGDDEPWFVLFSFDPSGYVKDDEGKKLDGAKILGTIREGTARANEVRKERGWGEMVIDGWVRAPYYDPSTHNLTWSIRGHSTLDSDGASVNHSVRLLGRKGVLHADLVASPEQMTNTVAVFDSVIASTAFLSGHKYSEWRKGDKVAAYGLTALVVGGAGVAAVKLGLFGKIGVMFAKLFAKLGKLVLVALAGVAAALKKIFSRKREATA
jgi:uncharacterized membrane-anchored protein